MGLAKRALRLSRHAFPRQLQVAGLQVQSICTAAYNCCNTINVHASFILSGLFGLQLTTGNMIPLFSIRHTPLTPNSIPVKPMTAATYTATGLQGLSLPRNRSRNLCLNLHIVRSSLRLTPFSALPSGMILVGGLVAIIANTGCTASDGFWDLGIGVYRLSLGFIIGFRVYKGL